MTVMGLDLSLTGTGVIKKCSKCEEEKPQAAEHFRYRLDKRDGKHYWNSTCRECERKATRLYQQKNKKKKQAYMKEYRSKNAEKIKASKKQYRIENAEKEKATQKKYRQQKQDKIAVYNKEYYWKNKQKEIERNVKYRRTDRGRVISKLIKYRRKKRLDSVPDVLTPGQWQECLVYFKNRCAYCGKKEVMTQDHFVPTVKGGPYSKCNILPACGSCNSRKRTIDFFKWYPKQEFYSSGREAKIIKYLHLNKADVELLMEGRRQQKIVI